MVRKKTWRLVHLPIFHCAQKKNYKALRKIHKSSKNWELSTNHAVGMGTNSLKKWLSSFLLAVLGSQGIVVKCPAAIFFS